MLTKTCTKIAKNGQKIHIKKCHKEPRESRSAKKCRIGFNKRWTFIASVLLSAQIKRVGAQGRVGHRVAMFVCVFVIHVLIHENGQSFIFCLFLSFFINRVGKYGSENLKSRMTSKQHILQRFMTMNNQGFCGSGTSLLLIMGKVYGCWSQ